jgi:saccharopine dehydrogenase-like NADP-dependent oxidoreductase
MEAFSSDGLRTLIDPVPGVRTMGEKTLRWPGHVEAVRPLVAAGRLVEELRERCTADEPRDLVALVVRLRWGKRALQATLVDRYDPATRLTAMARTTALTCSAAAQLAAGGGVRERGVLPLERVARDESAYRFVLDCLASRGVSLSLREN